MIDSLIGKTKSELDTPALLIDLDLFEKNIERLSQFCSAHNTSWRPHSKAHKSPQIARLLMDAGACGITCAKLSEAEVMVAQGIDQILIANQIVTPAKLRRLAMLQENAQVISTLDNIQLVTVMDEAARSMGQKIPVLVDIDIGMNRTGVSPGTPVLELARAIVDAAGLEFKGIMGYEGHVLDIAPPEEKIRVCQSSLDHLLASRDLLETNGIAVEIISAGGTGCYPITTAYPGITEIQAGGGIFMDLMYREACFVDDLDFALSLLGTVTSRHPTHAVIDAGFKSMSGFHHQPRPLKRDDLEFRYLSAEHGVWNIKDGCVGPQVGEQIEFLVGYSDSTNFMHEHFIGLRGEVVEVVWEIAARGKLH
jgi:D-serine deaminase-like pyridoxal phosphate-dependent protein